MIKLIRFIAFVVALVSFWSVYSRPEVRQVLFMGIDMELEDFESDHDEWDDDDGEYAYDDYDNWDSDDD